MADGIAKINPSEAIAKAETMKKLASEINNLLDSVDKKMQEINDESTNTYVGQRSPAELRAELDQYRSQFYKFYEQIELFSGNVVSIANKMMAE